MINSESDTIIIFTDGACLGNPGPGGYAALILQNGKEEVIVGGDPHTTNNRMELTAAIKALGALPEGVSATLHSDSEYVVKGTTEWLQAWKERGWKTGKRKAVLNRDLWEQLDALNAARNVTWQWVKGHAGHPQNESVDALANAEAERQSQAAGCFDVAYGTPLGLWAN